jgi:hypothetical protein
LAIIPHIITCTAGSRAKTIPGQTLPLQNLSIEFARQTKSVEISDPQKALDTASTKAIKANETVKQLTEDTAAKDTLILARGASFVSLADEENRLTSELAEMTVTIDELHKQKDFLENTRCWW